MASFLRCGCPSTSLVQQYGNFVPYEQLAVNSLFMGQISVKICCCEAFDVTFIYLFIYNNFICNNQYKKAAIREELNPHV